MFDSYFCTASLAQLVEHMTLNHQVAGSSPAGCTTSKFFTSKIIIKSRVLPKTFLRKSPAGCTNIYS